MKKQILSLLCVLALCLGLLPTTALAAAPNGQVIYVGNENVTSGGYWTTDSDGNVTASTAGGTPTDNYIHYDAENNVLTLHNATIKKGLEYNASIEGGTLISGSGIGVFNQSGNAELTINLVGTNTIADVSSGIYVLASSASTGSSNLTIQGDGSLNASASQTGILVQSNSNNATLCVENAEVTASTDGDFKNGVLVQAKDGSDVSLTVNGGSLTASVNANIWFQFGSGVSGSGTPTVTVSNNAIVRANGGIANNSSTSIQYGTGSDSTGGIVFDGNTGTVYGNVSLNENLTIGEGESLTIPEGASLNTNGNTITVENGGKLEGTPTGTVVYAPTITTESLPDGEVGTAYNQPLTATGDAPITWTVSGTLPDGLSLDAATGIISGTPTTEETSTFTVTATNNVGSASKDYTLTIKPAPKVPVTSVTLDQTELPLVVGGTAKLTATVEPDTATDKSVTWESNNPDVATVEDGTVTAKGAGEATITVKTADGGKTATCTVTVTQPVTGVKLDKTALSLVTGGSDTLTATVQPANATNQDVAWTSSDNKIATVDENGKVTAVGPGSATITVKTVDGGKTATCAVTVTQPVTGVTLDKTALSLVTGGSDTLTATVQPANATNQDVTWTSSDNNVATVDTNGKVTAVGPGSTTITVTTADGGLTASCTVTVTQPVTGVTLDKTALSLVTGGSDTLTATVQPANATNKAVTWTSSDNNVATVDENGTVTAVGPGSATITVTTADGGKTASCAVTVTQPVTGVTLDKTALSLVTGGSDTLTATVQPANATNQDVIWTSSDNNVATVDTNGTVTAVGPGSTTITVTTADGGLTASCTVTVTQPVTGVTLDKTTLALFTGDSATLTATVQPANATDKTVNWVSSNPAVVTVDGSGHVKAVAAGTANITATTTDGNKTAVCAVTVTGRTYALSSAPGAIAFGNVTTGYTPPAAQVVVIQNTGNQPLNLTQPKATNFGVGKLSETALKPGETATFIVQPKAGLGAGSYNETLTISGDGGAKATVNLSFVVQAPPAATATATPAPTPLEMHTLHFDTNGGLPMEDVKFGLGAPVELWPYTPVRVGYLFQGWYADQALTKAVGTIVLVKDTTIYAKWAPDPAAAVQSGSTGSGSGSGSGSKGGSTAKATPTPTPAPTATPEPTPTPTATPEATEAPIPTIPPQEEEEQGSFPVVPVAAGVIVLVVLVGGIAIYRRFRD